MFCISLLTPCLTLTLQNAFSSFSPLSHLSNSPPRPFSLRKACQRKSSQVEDIVERLWQAESHSNGSIMSLIMVWVSIIYQGWAPARPRERRRMMTTALVGRRWWALIPNDTTRPEQKVDKLQVRQSLCGLGPGGWATARPAHHGALDWKISHDWLLPQGLGWLSGDPVSFEIENWVTSRCLGTTCKPYLPYPVCAVCVCRNFVCAQWCGREAVTGNSHKLITHAPQGDGSLRTG